jgi:opacity protein-like surface antigen
MMKRISVVTLIVLVLAASSALAEPIADRFMLNPKFGFTWQSSAQDNETFTGYAASLSIERNVYGQSYALGFDVGYMWATDEFEAEGFEETVKIDQMSLPILATMKYMWSTKRLSLHLGLGMGVHKSWTSANVTWEKDEVWGFAMAVPIGLKVWLAENFFVNANYQLGWLLSRTLTEDRVTTVNIGLGFQF